MGRREFLIIAVFVAAALIAYGVSEPRSDAPRRRFSLASLVDDWHGRPARGRAAVSATHRGAIEVTAGIEELRLTGLARVTIVGEPRSDILYDLTVDASGPDLARARVLADRARIAEDHAGSVLSLRIATEGPSEARLTSRLLLRVPSSLRVRLEAPPGRAAVEVSSVAAVSLDNVVGDVEIRRVVGALTGTHRNGDLTVNEAGSVTMTLGGSRGTFTGIHGAVALTARNGHSHIDGAGGPVTLDVTAQEVAVTNPAGPVQVTGTGGQITIEGPAAPITITVRNARVDVGLTKPTVVTAFTSANMLRVRLDTPDGVHLDAAATDGGSIRADEFALSSTSDGRTARLDHAFGRATVRVALRNERGAIVIARR